ncbi:Cro protein [Mycobacterium phage Aegeus]|nr:Cro protein [Mycobacterium phage Baudelaire]WKW86536.1 Cro protein [Mycobacterium phage Aegeus]
MRDLMRINGIETREELARETGEPPTTVRRAFNNNWQGRANCRMMAAISYRFNVPVNNLIIDPRRTPTLLRAKR